MKLDAAVHFRRLDRIPLPGRLLLTSDGTVTPMLEQIVGEPIVTAGLTVTPVAADDDSVGLLPGGQELHCRRTDLVGAVTGTVHVRARSILAVDLLPPQLRADLAETDEPIGVLLRRHRLETYRELLWWRVHPGEGDEEAGAGRPPTPRASRRYRLFTGGQAALLIQETFFASCLRNQ
ncbi:chorismate--pyruvate lyase family protein [Micromonospora echinospora]